MRAAMQRDKKFEFT